MNMQYSTIKYTSELIYENGAVDVVIFVICLIKGRHNGGLIYFGGSYKHCQHDLADHYGCESRIVL